MREQEFYCVKCRDKVSLPTEDICVKYIKNKRATGGKVPVLAGKCKYCKINTLKFIPRDMAVKAERKYGKC